MIENFNNIIILERYTSSYSVITYILAVIAIIILVCLICLIAIFNFRIKYEKIASWIYIICLISQIYGIITHIWLHPPIEYKIIFNDEMTATEYFDFIDQFRIMEQDGEVYTVRLRE